MIYLKRVLLVPIIAFALAGAALAHEVGLKANIQARKIGGGTITYNEGNLPRNAQVTLVQIVAYYSTGKAMSDCQVRVFAPGTPETPWRTGTCDRQGRYTFTPDLAKRGRWTVRVQSSGHSSFINIVL